MSDTAFAVLASYLTVGGATVDVTHEPFKGGLFARCLGCTWHDRTWTHDQYDDTPEQTADRIAEGMPSARTAAQAHSEKCRALPSSTN